MSYSIAHHRDGELSRFTVSGAADVRAAEDLAVRLERLRSVTTIDLSEATLVDSRMMALLVQATERLRAIGADLEIVCTAPDVLRLFRRMGLDGELTLTTGERRTTG